MLLIVKGKPTRARCGKCKRLYEPTASELRQPKPALICSPCVKEIEARLESTNPRERWAAI